MTETEQLSPQVIRGRVLALLSEGMPDEAIARHIGRSIRTVRRIIATYMAETGAHSRFQMGLYAACRGDVVLDREQVEVGLAKRRKQIEHEMSMRKMAT